MPGRARGGSGCFNPSPGVRKLPEPESSFQQEGLLGAWAEGPTQQSQERTLRLLLQTEGLNKARESAHKVGVPSPSPTNTQAHACARAYTHERTRAHTHTHMFCNLCPASRTQLGLRMWGPLLSLSFQTIPSSGWGRGRLRGEGLVRAGANCTQMLPSAKSQRAFPGQSCSFLELSGPPRAQSWRALPSLMRQQSLE